MNRWNDRIPVCRPLVALNADVKPNPSTKSAVQAFQHHRARREEEERERARMRERGWGREREREGGTSRAALWIGQGHLSPSMIIIIIIIIKHCKASVTIWMCYSKCCSSLSCALLSTFSLRLKINGCNWNAKTLFVLYFRLKTNQNLKGIDLSSLLPYKQGLTTNLI